MNPRPSGRTRACSETDAVLRLETAKKFSEVAQLVADEGEDVAYSSQSAALAVLAGIAASDAACCQALGRRSRAQDHRHAALLLDEINPGGRKAAQSLKRLLSLKDEAQYGLLAVSGSDLRSALRHAAALLAFAEQVLRRSARSFPRPSQ